MPDKTLDPGARTPPKAGGHAAVPGAAAVSDALKEGPRGALFLSAIAVALLFIGWVAFYFLLFLARGSIG